MDSEKKHCDMMHSIKFKKTELFGLLLIVFASLLTYVTSEGLGILGMFIAGICLFKRHSWGCKCPCCKSSECSDEVCYESCESKDVKVEKKAKPKAKSKAK
jgi:hypothetical protein